MSKTVKRALWQRTLETAGPLRKALPVAANAECQWTMPDADAQCLESRRFEVDEVCCAFGVDPAAVGAYLGWYDFTEFRRQEDGSMKPFRWSRPTLFGMDFAQGGARDQTGVRLVGETGPELHPGWSSLYDTMALEAALQQWQRDLVEELCATTALSVLALWPRRAGKATMLREADRAPDPLAGVVGGAASAPPSGAGAFGSGYPGAQWVKQMVREINEASGGRDGD